MLKNNDKGIVICYFGTLVKNRGSEFIYNLLLSNSDIDVVCAGWISDKYSEDLLRHQKVKYLGVINQEEANQYLSQYADYLLAIYPENNLNNLNASPNKIYDAIHAEVPVIINKNIKVSNFVLENNTGVVVDMHNIDYPLLAKKLLNNKGLFSYDENLKNKFSWETTENILLKACNED